MIHLSNGCKCSKLSVYPRNWQTRKAKVNIIWYIMYRFYDPKFIKPKQVMVQGMNQFKNLTERQFATQKALDAEMSKLTKEAFNPFTKDHKTHIEQFVLHFT